MRSQALHDFSDNYQMKGKFPGKIYTKFCHTYSLPCKCRITSRRISINVGLPQMLCPDFDDINCPVDLYSLLFFIFFASRLRANTLPVDGVFFPVDGVFVFLNFFLFTRWWRRSIVLFAESPMKLFRCAPVFFFDFGFVRFSTDLSTWPKLRKIQALQTVTFCVT